MSTAGNALPLAAAGRSGAAGYERIPDPSERTPARYDSIGRRIVERPLLTDMRRPGDWVSDALCSEIGGDLWFPPMNSNGTEAKAICAECDVKSQCLEWVITNNEREGIWGGLSPSQRARLRRKGTAA